MKGWPALVFVLAVLVSGCFGGNTAPARPVQPAAVGYDVSAVHVDTTRSESYNLTSWDGVTKLSAYAVVPVMNGTMPGGGKPAWPLVIFLHGWGGSKDGYAARQADFAAAGFMALAYDARGFGASGGNATVAGPAEQADLAAIITDAKTHFGPIGRIGVVGQSYGGGQALLAWANNPDVTTVVSQYGWTDLAAGLIPGNVPKVEWAQTLYFYGLIGSKVRYDPAIHQWYQQLYTRQDLASVKAQLDQRSVAGHMATVTRPLLACQGMQETLFPQIDSMWQAGGFVRTYVYQGGHGGDDDGCWSRTLDWFKFFLAGQDTRVDSWPAMETVDAAVAGTFQYDSMPHVAATTLHLRAPDLYVGQASDATFEIRQSLLGNPTAEPSALWDKSGMPNGFLPDGLRADPTAVTFTTPIEQSTVLVGASTLHLHVATGSSPLQVVATLAHVRADGSSQVIGHAAAAVLASGDATENNVTLSFQWTRAALGPGDKLQLRVASNDESWWMPLLQNYDVNFDGQSWLSVPFA